jgi:hypothetical protein
MSLADNKPASVAEIGAAVSSPAANTLNARMKTVADTLASINSDTTPVNVDEKPPILALVARGAPGSTLGNTAYSNPFTANSRSISAKFTAFATGTKRPVTGAYVLLERDLAGGTSYVEVVGSRRMLADVLTDFVSGTSGNSFDVTWPVDVQGGNYRIRCFFGAMSGTDAFGYNVTVRS